MMMAVGFVRTTCRVNRSVEEHRLVQRLPHAGLRAHGVKTRERSQTHMNQLGIVIDLSHSGDRAGDLDRNHREVLDAIERFRHASVQDRETEEARSNE